MKGKGEVKGWITRHGVHVPIYGDYTVRGGVEPKAKSAKVKSGKKPKRGMTNKELDAANRELDAKDAEADMKKYEAEHPMKKKPSMSEEDKTARTVADHYGVSVDKAKEGIASGKYSDDDIKTAKDYKATMKNLEDKRDAGSISAEDYESSRKEAIKKFNESRKAKVEAGQESSTPTIHETRLQRQAVNEKAGLKSDRNQNFKTAYQNEQTSSTPDFSKMSYSEAGRYVSEHKKDFGLKPEDDAYMAAYEMKHGTWKTPENSSTESPKLNTKENYRAVKQSNKTATSKLTAEERQYKSDNAAASKADAYNDKLLADFKAGGKDYQRVSMEDYAGTITDFKVAAKRAGVDYEYDQGDDTFYLRKSKQESSTSKTESNAGKRYSTSSANYGNTYTAQHLGEYSISGLKKAYAEAPAALKSKIKAEMQKRGYKFSGGRWIKG